MVFADMVSAVLGWDSRSLLPLAPPTPSPVPLHCRERPSGEERPFLCPLGLCPSTLTHWKPHFSFLCWIRRAWISLVSVQWKFWFHYEPRRKQINMKPKDETVLALGCWEAEWLLYPIQELNHVKSKIVSLLMEALRARSFPQRHTPSPMATPSPLLPHLLLPSPCVLLLPAQKWIIQRLTSRKNVGLIRKHTILEAGPDKDSLGDQTLGGPFFFN